jgi:cytochrome c oxidase subunit 1
MAGLKGMLRRTLYFDGEFDLYMLLAMVCGGLLLIGFLAFFLNIVMSVGVNGVIGIFSPVKNKNKELVPASE